MGLWEKSKVFFAMFLLKRENIIEDSLFFGIIREQTREIQCSVMCCVLCVVHSYFVLARKREDFLSYFFFNYFWKSKKKNKRNFRSCLTIDHENFGWTYFYGEEFMRIEEGALENVHLNLEGGFFFSPKINFFCLIWKKSKLKIWRRNKYSLFKSASI